MSNPTRRLGVDDAGIDEHVLQGLNTQQETLHARIKAAYSDTEVASSRFFAALFEAYRQKLHEACGFTTLARYLVASLDMPIRTAERVSLTVAAFADLGLPDQSFAALGPTRAAELASTVIREGLKARAAKKLVSQALDENWTSRDISRFRRKRQEPETGATDAPRTKESGPRSLASSVVPFARTSASPTAVSMAASPPSADPAVGAPVTPDSVAPGLDSLSDRLMSVHAELHGILRSTVSGESALGTGEAFARLEVVALTMILGMAHFVDPELSDIQRTFEQATVGLSPEGRSACLERAANVAQFLTRLTEKCGHLA